MNQKELYIGRIKDLEKIPIKQYEIGSRSIMLSRVDDTYYATDAICTHKEVSLAEGVLEGSIITCPQHGGKFDVATGAAKSLPAIVSIGTYPTVIKGSNIFILVEQKPFQQELVKKQFPIFDNVRDKFYYLDSAATTQKPKSVIDKLEFFYENINSNVHRGTYSLSELATEAYEQARAKIAKFIKATEPKEIIFTKSTTESINLVAYTWGEENIQEGDEILISILEHHSNFIPWQQLAKRKKAILKVISYDDNGLITTENIVKELSEKTKLVAVTHISNVTGAIIPIEDLIIEAHAVGAKVLVDAAQSVAHVPIDVEKLDCDWLAFSGHKMYGPTGVGVLYGKKNILEGMQPFLYGGGMIKKVLIDDAEWADLPYKFEAGTPPIAEAVALAVAADFIEDIGFEAIVDHEAGLVRYALGKLKKMPKLGVIGPLGPNRGGIISFNIEGSHAHDIANLVSEHGVCVRAGFHCAEPLHEKLGLRASCRLSFAIYNSAEDVDRLIDALDYSKNILKI